MTVAPYDSYLSVTQLTVDQNVAGNTACHLRWRVQGDCVGCELFESQTLNTQPSPLDDMEGVLKPEWSFSPNVTPILENGSLKLTTQEAAEVWAEWTFPGPPFHNMKREYLGIAVHTDPTAVTNAELFEHAHFTDTDGSRLRLVDNLGRYSEWNHGGPAGVTSDRLGLGGWTFIVLQHWFESPTTTSGALNITKVRKIRFTFNTVNPAVGRVYHLDSLNLKLREGAPMYFGAKYLDDPLNPLYYRTREAGDVLRRQVPVRISKDYILQLEVAAPPPDVAGCPPNVDYCTCEDEVSCACNAIHATIDAGYIPVDDDGERFNRIAPGFWPPPSPPGGCGLGFELVGVLPLLLWVQARRRP